MTEATTTLTRAGFQPALRDGKPVAATVRVPVEFALERG